MDYTDLNPPIRTLLGPGPSNVHPRVLKAMATPLVGHLDPAFLEVMDEVKRLLQFVFETENNLTIPLSGTGSAGMEASLFNLIEEGDKVVTRWTLKGKHTGELMGIAATNKQATVKGITIDRFEGGKIVEEWNKIDQMGMMYQLGVIKPPGHA